LGPSAGRAGLGAGVPRVPNEGLISPVASECSTDVPRSGRPSPDPARVYGVSQVQDARRAYPGGRAGAPPAVPGSVGGSRPSRSSSASRSVAAAAGAAVVAGKPGAAAGGEARDSVFAYLKVYGLNQYARAFAEVGYGDLEAIGRLSETEALEFLERLRVYPGHRLRLLRAIDCLRHAAAGAERKDAAQLLEDDAALGRLCAQNEELSKEKHEAQGENEKLQEDNQRLLSVVQQQDAQIHKHQSRIGELEEMVQAQTEQVNFLMMQLQNVAQESATRQSELFRSYRGAFEDTQNDWADAQSIELPDVTQHPGDGDGGQERARAYTQEDFARAQAAASAAHSAAQRAPASAVSGLGSESPLFAHQRRFADATGAGDAQASFSPPGRSKHAQTLDSAQVRECLAGFDVDHIIRCLAAALQNKVITAVGKSRPHVAPPERTQACSIFLEPACLERLERVHAQQLAKLPGADGTTPLSSLAVSGSADLRDSMGKPVDALNAVAVRAVPGKWDVYGFLRDVMVNFRLEPEVSVVTLHYLERFHELSGIALTPDNWRRVVITAMMLASKVWNDESFENIEFAQLCPLYTIDEINTFERIFLKSVGYNMSMKGSEYAKTYFLLRTLGAKDAADFGLEPLDNVRASRLQERCLEKQLEFRERYPEDVGSAAMNWTL